MTEFAGRISELREVLGETDDAMGRRFGRAAKQIGVWRAGGQAPHHRTLERVARENGWDVQMFYDGGPRPAAVVNRPVNDRSGGGAGKVRESPNPEPYGAPDAASAQAAQAAALMALAEYLAPGAPFGGLARIMAKLYEAGWEAGRLERDRPTPDRG